MSAHRLRDHFLTVRPVFAAPDAHTVAFVPCPLFASFSASQQCMVQEVYRVAAERTREQMRPKRNRMPAFSVN